MQAKNTVEPTIYCDCVRFKAWDCQSTGRWECRKIECACEERVDLVVENVKQGSNELNITYKCANKQCGFKIAAHDANYHTYVSIIKDLQPYLFWHTNKKCECREEMRMSIERITVGAGVEDPAKQRSIELDNELQLVYVCSTGRCSYCQSVPQIESKEGIRCVCSLHMIYHADKRIYLCPKSNGGCGACFHEMDSLTYMHVEIAKVAVEDHAWLSLRRKAMEVCGQRGFLKNTN